MKHTHTHVTTTCGEFFSSDEHADLAWLIFRRWGRNTDDAAIAWRRLFQNSTDGGQFEKLAFSSRLSDRKTPRKFP